MPQPLHTTFEENDLVPLLPPQMIGRKIFIIVSGLILPALLIPVISIIGYSEVIEEIAKTLIIGFIILTLPRVSQKVSWTFIFALLFGISETMFYFAFIVNNGAYNILLDRFLFTVPMHILAALIIVGFGLVKKRYVVVGVLVAIALHLAFNHFIVLLIS